MMKRLPKGILALLVAAAFSAACGSDNNDTTTPTAPTPTPPTTGGNVALAVTGMTPGQVFASSQPQTIHISGTGFQSGYSFVLKGPGTGAKLYGPSSLNAEGSDAFGVVVTISQAGAWSATVMNSDGTSSAEFPFTVKWQPIVTSISPASPVHAASEQMFTVNGSGFSGPGLTYVVKGPDTGAVLHDSSDVSNLSATSFQAKANFTVAGNWTITVIGPDGVTSDQFAFVVR